MDSDAYVIYMLKGIIWLEEEREEGIMNTEERQVRQNVLLMRLLAVQFYLSYLLFVKITYKRKKYSTDDSWL
jgi:hypothetical protein